MWFVFFFSSEFWNPCNRQQAIEYFHHLQQFPCAPVQSVPGLQPQETTDLLSLLLWVVPVQEFPMKGSDGV